MIPIKIIKMIDVSDWDNLVSSTYNRVYSFQQQDGCQERGVVNITVPEKYTEDDEMHDSIPEKLNGEEMGVKFKSWLERDPKQPMKNQKNDWELSMFWERNFYPDLSTVANDLYERGLIEAGDYTINIDW